MDTGHIALGLVAVAAAGAAVWFLIERGRLMVRVASADVEARASGDRAATSERAHRELAGELSELGRRLSTAQADVARVQEALQREQEERRDERKRSEAEVVRAVEAERRVHAQELNNLATVHAEKLAAVAEAKQQIDQRLEEFDRKMKESFGALAGEALSKSSTDFLRLAGEKLNAKTVEAAAQLDERRVAVEGLIKPIAETLRKTDAKLAEFDRSRGETAAAIGEQIRGVLEANRLLREETGKLGRALREPHVRGRYGELQLRRVAELSGMSAYCDFDEQNQTVDGDGNPLKPDMIVRMPSERVVVVDAKTNIQSYLEALQAASPEDAEVCLERFARHVSKQATALAQKKYWAQYDGSPEFVVMFIPGDQFIDAALSRQPELLEAAARQGVLLAGPATLIGLLRAVAVGYGEQRLALEGRELRELGREFHDRACKAMGDIADVGTHLGHAVKRYNEFVASYEGRLEPTLRKFEDSGVKSGKTLPKVKVVDAVVREIEAKPVRFSESSTQAS